MKASKELEDQVAIVTGGGTGIGLAIAKEMAAAGADVVVCSRSIERLKVDVEKAISPTGRRCLVIPADVRKPEDVDNLVQKTMKEFGRIDILVNNAGASFHCLAEDMSPNGWDAVINANLKGTFLCCRAAGKVMIQQKRGNVINISSLAGYMGTPTEIHYGAAKAGVISVTKTLAIEWAKHNIRVNCIAPGPVVTEGFLAVLKKGGIKEPPPSPYAMKRWGQPVEIAKVAIFLASEAASFITGETICVSGGPLTVGALDS
jgi:NAD(P)-dependent dehydrogenase (short-subunit alcohol dehydrogenase family)